MKPHKHSFHQSVVGTEGRIELGWEGVAIWMIQDKMRSPICEAVGSPDFSHLPRMGREWEVVGRNHDETENSIWEAIGSIDYLCLPTTVQHVC